ncbi:MAG: hypothetical protein MHMPM18_001291 [Marteilia pararefringens]
MVSLFSCIRVNMGSLLLKCRITCKIPYIVINMCRQVLQKILEYVSKQITVLDNRILGLNNVSHFQNEAIKLTNALIWCDSSVKIESKSSKSSASIDSIRFLDFLRKEFDFSNSQFTRFVRDDRYIYLHYFKPQLEDILKLLVEYESMNLLEHFNRRIHLLYNNSLGTVDESSLFYGPQFEDLLRDFANLDNQMKEVVDKYKIIFTSIFGTATESLLDASYGKKRRLFDSQKYTFMDYFRQIFNFQFASDRRFQSFFIKVFKNELRSFVDGKHSCRKDVKDAFTAYMKFAVNTPDLLIKDIDNEISRMCRDLQIELQKDCIVESKYLDITRYLDDALIFIRKIFDFFHEIGCNTVQKSLIVYSINRIIIAEPCERLNDYMLISGVEELVGILDPDFYYPMSLENFTKLFSSFSNYIEELRLSVDDTFYKYYNSIMRTLFKTSFTSLSCAQNILDRTDDRNILICAQYFITTHMVCHFESVLRELQRQDDLDKYGKGKPPIANLIASIICDRDNLIPPDSILNHHSCSAYLLTAIFNSLEKQSASKASAGTQFYSDNDTSEKVGFVSVANRLRKNDGLERLLASKGLGISVNQINIMLSDKYSKYFFGQIQNDHQFRENSSSSLSSSHTGPCALLFLGNLARIWSDIGAAQIEMLLVQIDYNANNELLQFLLYECGLKQLWHKTSSFWSLRTGQEINTILSDSNQLIMDDSLLADLRLPPLLSDGVQDIIEVLKKDSNETILVNLCEVLKKPLYLDVLCPANSRYYTFKLYPLQASFLIYLADGKTTTRDLMFKANILKSDRKLVEKILDYMEAMSLIGKTTVEVDGVEQTHWQLSEYLD